MGWITEKAVIGQKGVCFFSFDALDNYICAMQHACSGSAWFFRALQIFCLFPCLFLPFFFAQHYAGPLTGQAKWPAPTPERYPGYADVSSDRHSR